MQNFSFHQHTYRCGHADNSMKDEDYIKEYINMGFKKMAFTDHCPEKEKIDPVENIRMDYDKRGEYLESINTLKEKYKNQIEILSGYEIEYLPGQEDNLKELKDETDILILGQHFIYDTDGKVLRRTYDDPYSDEDVNTYTEYIETAIKLGLPDIIGHPDFVLKSRKGFGKADEMATRRICEVAEKYSIPLEINLNNIFKKTIYNDKEDSFYNFTEEEQLKKLEEVVYPSREFWKIVSEYNVKVLYGLDVHFRKQISSFEKLVFFANKIIGKETIDKLNFIEDL